MNERRGRLRDSLEEPLLVTNATNVRYLTGFVSSNAALLVGPEGAQLFTDFRYVEAARAVEGVEVVLTRNPLLGDVAERLSGRLGFEPDALTFAQVELLRGGGLELVPRQGLVERLRAVKDEGELASIRRACGVADRVYERLVDEVRFVGRTERDVSWDLTRLFHEEGGEGLSFESIVGSGPTGARPHARAGERKIARGELVVVDAGCTVDGYCSDYTRTFATGPLDGETREAYAVVLAAQQAALDVIRAGLPAVDADSAARQAIEASPFAGTFGHGLGHGVGLDIHEAPRLSADTKDVLVAGNVVTVEPGVYLEGRFGIRIEDDVLVTDGGLENLTGIRKDLVEVG